MLGAGLEIAIKPDLAQVRALGGGAAGAALARWVLGITFMLVVTVHFRCPSKDASIRLHAIDARVAAMACRRGRSALDAIDATTPPRRHRVTIEVVWSIVFTGNGPNGPKIEQETTHEVASMA